MKMKMKVKILFPFLCGTNIYTVAVIQPKPIKHDERWTLITIGMFPITLLSIQTKCLIVIACVLWNQTNEQ